MNYKRENRIRHFILIGLLAALSLFGAANEVTAQGPGDGRSVEFLGSADPQFNHAQTETGCPSGQICNCLDSRSACYRQNNMADQTMAAMRNLVLTTSLRGIVIAGDLTQNTWDSEFSRYRDSASGTPNRSSQVYDGMGNHDYDDGGAIDDIYDWVGRTRQSPLFTVAGFQPHYSWDWEDVHLVQLNLYPGAGLTTCSNSVFVCHPKESLAFLELDLLINVRKADGQPDYTRPIIIIHHYGPDAIGRDWSNGEAVAYWNVITDYNVIAILFGHTNRIPEQDPRYHFENPGGLDRPDCRTTIPAFEIGSAKGVDPSGGAYTYINMHEGHQIEIERRSTNGNVHHEWCVPIDSEFFLDPGTGSLAETGTSTRPFKSLALAVSAMRNYDPSCPLVTGTPNSCPGFPARSLPVPILHVSESRHTVPIRLDTPMRIMKWNP